MTGSPSQIIEERGRICNTRGLVPCSNIVSLSNAKTYKHGYGGYQLLSDYKYEKGSAEASVSVTLMQSGGPGSYPG